MSTIGKTMNRRKPLGKLAERYGIYTDFVPGDPRTSLFHARSARRYYISSNRANPGQEIYVPTMIYTLVRALTGR